MNLCENIKYNKITMEKNICLDVIKHLGTNIGKQNKILICYI